MPRWLRALLTGVMFLTFSLGGAALGWLLLPFAVARHRSSLAQRRRSQAVLHRWGYGTFVRLGTALGLIEFIAPRLLVDGGRRAVRAPPGALLGPPLALPRGPFILVANHPALMDVMFLLAAFPAMACLVKRAWFASPLIGPLLRHGAYLPGPDGADDEPPGATPVLDGIVARLREGTPVLVFPEGTRSPPGGLGRFRRGAAEAALRAGVPLVPVVIRCDPPTLTKGQPWWAVPERTIRYTVEALAPVDPRAVGLDARALTRALQARYEEALGLRAASPEGAERAASAARVA